VVVAEAVGVVQPADGGDDFAVTLQGLEAAAEAVVPPRFQDLVVEGVDPVGQVDEDAALGRPGSGAGGGGPQRSHAVEEGQGNGGAEAPEDVAAVQEPVLALDVHGVCPCFNTESS